MISTRLMPSRYFLKLLFAFLIHASFFGLKAQVDKGGYLAKGNAIMGKIQVGSTTGLWTPVIPMRLS